MADLILTQKRVQANAREKDGIVLYWVDELKIAGIHIRGIARLLDCNPKTVSKAISDLNAVTQFKLLEAETITPSGIQGVTLVSESDLPKVLRKIERSRCQEETRERAGDVRDRLAAAGFKLMVMLELVPEQLKEQVDRHVSRRAHELELELKLIEKKELLLALHGKDMAFRLMGDKEAVVYQEFPITELVEPATGRTTKILTADQLKKAVKERTGQRIPSMKSFTDALRKAGRDDLLVPVTRSQTSEHVPPDRLEEAIAIVFGKQRQRLIGE